MPLSPPAARQHIHERAVYCRGYRRADGLWDVEGHLTDVKTYAFGNAFRGVIEPGEPLHDMWLRLTVDDELTIVAAEAAMDKFPYHICSAIAPAFAQLEGLKIGPGFSKKVQQRLGGVNGCTHLVELIRPVATAAFQTIYPILARERGELPDERHARAPGHMRPTLLNSCHTYASDSEVVRVHWPEFYTGTDRPLPTAGSADA